jgi:predicted dehydrogenase
MGPYYMTELVLLFGPVTRVTATGGRARDTRVIGAGPRAGTEFAVEVPTTVSALIEFAGGGSAQLVLSFDSALPRTGIEVTGTLGTAVLPDPHRFDGATRLYLPDRAEPEEVPARGHPARRGTGVLELARAIRAGVPERASGELAFHVLDVMLAVEESITAGRTVLVASRVEIPPALPADWNPYAKTL